MDIIYIVNFCKFDKKSAYGRILTVGGMNVCEEPSKKYQTYFFSILFAFLTICSVISLSAFDMTGKSVVIFDGKNKKQVNTRSSNFKDVVVSSGIKLGKYDTFWASTDKVENGSIVVVERAVPVTISANGKTTKIYTTQQTVQGVVNDAGYDWQTMMPLEDGFSKVKDGMTIHVVPYEKRTVVRKEKLPVSYIRWYDPYLGSTALEVIDPGRPGEMAVTTEEYVSDGKVLRSDVVSSEMVDEGIEGSMKVGTPEETVGQILHMSATAYHPSDGDGRGITATGTQAGYGTVAVDPNVIPLGSTVYIPGYGEAVASDTGGAIRGNRIDLCMETFAECYNFGVRNVEVYISNL